jgi:hypothetical protein
VYDGATVGIGPAIGRLAVKFTWEENDIRAGVKFRKRGTQEVHMVGYMADRSENLYVWISVSDGMVQPPVNRIQFAESLNASGYEPA